MKYMNTIKRSRRALLSVLLALALAVTLAGPALAVTPPDRLVRCDSGGAVTNHTAVTGVTLPVVFDTNPLYYLVSVDAGIFASGAPVKTMTGLTSSNLQLGLGAVANYSAGTVYEIKYRAHYGVAGESTEIVEAWKSTGLYFLAETAPVTYALTVSAGTGGTITAGTSGDYTAGAVVTITAAASAGYAFDHWTSTGGGTLGSASSASTTYTMPAHAASVTATFQQTGGGGGGGSGGGTQTGTETKTIVSDNGKSTDTTVTGTTDSTGKASEAAVTGDDVKGLLDQASHGSGGLTGVKNIEFDVKSAGSVTSVELNVPAASFKELADKTNAVVTVSTGVGAVTFNAKAVDAIAGAGSTGDVSISIARLDNASLPDNVKKTVGSHPVYDFTVTSGGKTVSSFGGGTAAVSVPYTLAPGENPNNIVIYFISDSGALVKVKNCKYDPATGTVTFTTSHFSRYAVGYSDVRFTDVSGWYADYVSFLAARGIMNGQGGGLFKPGAPITRAEFVTVLANMSGDELTVYTASSFSDVKTTDWFFRAAQWACDKGVASGYGGAFSPNAPVTRQDIAVMLARYAEKVAAFTLPETVAPISFTDRGKIAPYASAAVSTMQRAGVISGKDDGSFAPAAPATRAEAAKMVAVLVQLMAG